MLGRNLSVHGLFPITLQSCALTDGFSLLFSFHRAILPIYRGWPAFGHPWPTVLFHSQNISFQPGYGTPSKKPGSFETSHILRWPSTSGMSQLMLLVAILSTLATVHFACSLKVSFSSNHNPKYFKGCTEPYLPPLLDNRRTAELMTAGEHHRFHLRGC